MHVFGRGRFQYLTARLPDPEAARFSAQLHRTCGCHLAWHLRRGVYVVYRNRGPNVAPQTYNDIEYPLLWMLPHVVDSIHMADARLQQDFEQMHEVYNRRWKDDDSKETQDFVDGFLPEITKDMRRYEELLSSGGQRVDTKYFDTKPRQMSKSA